MFSNKTSTISELSTPSTAITAIEQVAGPTTTDPNNGTFRARYWTSGNQTLGVFMHAHDLNNEDRNQLLDLGFEETKNPNVLVWWFDAVEHHKETS